MDFRPLHSEPVHMILLTPVCADLSLVTFQLLLDKLLYVLNELKSVEILFADLNVQFLASFLYNRLM